MPCCEVASSAEKPELLDIQVVLALTWFCAHHASFDSLVSYWPFFFFLQLSSRLLICRNSHHWVLGLVWGGGFQDASLLHSSPLEVCSSHVFLKSFLPRMKWLQFLQPITWRPSPLDAQDPKQMLSKLWPPVDVLTLLYCEPLGSCKNCSRKDSTNQTNWQPIKSCCLAILPKDNRKKERKMWLFYTLRFCPANTFPANMLLAVSWAGPFSSSLNFHIN